MPIHGIAPHNVYQCWGVDRWLALEIHSDEEFVKLAQIITKPELASDPRFADMASRKKNEKELDQLIESWTKERDRDWMVGEFCKAGLMAAPSREGRDLYADEHLRARGGLGQDRPSGTGRTGAGPGPLADQRSGGAHDRRPAIGQTQSVCLRRNPGA